MPRQEKDKSNSEETTEQNEVSDALRTMAQQEGKTLVEKQEGEEAIEKKKYSGIVFRIGAGSRGDFVITLHGDSYHTVRYGNIAADSKVYVRIGENGEITTEAFRAGDRSSPEKLFNQEGLDQGIQDVKEFVASGEYKRLVDRWEAEQKKTDESRKEKRSEYDGKVIYPNKYTGEFSLSDLGLGMDKK